MGQKHISAYRGAGLKIDRVTKKEKKEHVSAYAAAVKNRGGVAGGIGYVAKRAGIDFLRVGEGVVDAALVPVDLITGNVERAKSRFMDSPVDAMRERLEEEYNPGKVASFIGDITGGIGQSVGYGLISAIPYAGKPMMYSSIIEQSISSAAEKTGNVGWREVGYGATAGAVEGLLESKLGAGVNAAKGIGSAILKKTGLNVAESAAKAGGKTMLKSVLVDTAKGAAGEFAEEAISEAVDPALLRLYNIDENAQFSLKDVAYAGLIGGLSGGIMSAGPAAINYRSAVSVGRALQEQKLDGELINRARTTLKALEASQTRAQEQVKGKPQGDTKETFGEWMGRTAENRRIKRLSKETKELADKVRKNIAAYENSIQDPYMAKSDPVAALLGELRGNLFLVGYAYEADVIEQVLMDASDEHRKAFVAIVNEELAKQGKKHDYTLADFDSNKDDIRRGLAGRIMEDELFGLSEQDGDSEQSTAEAAESPAEAEQDPWAGMPDDVDIAALGATGEAEEALVREAIRQSVPQGSVPEMLNQFRKGTKLTPEDFAYGWSDGVHLVGRYDLNIGEESADTAFGRMEQEARDAAVKYGRDTAEAQRKAEEEKAKAKKKPAPKEEAENGAEGKIIKGEGLDVQKLSDEQYAAYKACELMARVLGTDIVIETNLGTDNGKTINGFYDQTTNRIHININAIRDGKNIATYILGHEVTHYIREWSPKKFHALGDFVMKQLRQDAETAIMAKLASLKGTEQMKGKTLQEAYDLAYEEVVADGMELILTDGKVLDELARTDRSIWQKVKAWISNIIAKIKKYYGELNQASKTARVLAETMDSLDEIERLFYEGVREAGERTRTAGVEVEVGSDGNIIYAIGDEKAKSASDLSEEDLRAMLESAQNGMLDDGTYIPLRRNTPEFYIEVVRDHSKGKVMVQNYPMAATVRHLRQNMEEVDGQSYGEERPHELSPDEIVTISTKMGDPAYIVLQKNGRYAEVVSYYDSKKKKEVVVSIDIADSNSKPPKNYKDSLYMNGYDGGYYNIIVTQHELDDLQSYLNGTTVVYDKKKTNGKYQVGSGRVVTVAHDTPFVEDIIPQAADSVNRKFSISEENSSESPDVSENAPELTDRELLLTMAEQLVGSEEENKILSDYKAKMADQNARQTRVNELTEEQREQQSVLFTSADAEARSKASKRLKDIYAELGTLSEELAKVDRKLAEIEGMSVMRNLLKREYAKAREVQKNIYEARYKKKTEAKETTEARRQTRRIYNRLYRMLAHPTKTKNVPYELQGIASEALRAANMDLEALERLEELEEQLGKLEREAVPDPEKIAKKEREIESQEKKVGTTKEQLQVLIDIFKKSKEIKEGVGRSVYDEDALTILENLKNEIGNVSIRNANKTQLKNLNDFYNLLHTRIRNANKMLVEGRKEQVSDWGNTTSREASERKPLYLLSPKEMERKGMQGVREFLWRNMKPLTVFEAIGSPKFMELFQAVLDGEAVWIRDVLEGREAIIKAKETYGYDKWDLKTRHEFTNAEGKTVRLTIGEMMSLYAYGKREQAKRHLWGGGFVLESAATEITEKNKIRTERALNSAERYTMTDEDLVKLEGMLTEEQKKYATEMQDYLTSLGKKGNEVSRKLYGIDLFTEEHYFPIKVKSEYLESQTGKTGDPKIKNRGYAKETVPDADNPLVLQDFMKVVTGHVNDMATYHAFVLPVEDLTRVLNYKPSNVIIDEDGNWTEDTERKDYSTLKAVIEDKYGAQANAYIEQLIRDLNGGARREAATSLIDKGITAFKRASTMASLSVLIQQPTSLFRAMAYVDPKYFRSLAALDVKNHKEAWEQVKKYAEVAAIKEMGGHDTNTGARTEDYLNSKEYKTWGDRAKAFFLPTLYGGDANYRAEIFGKGAAYADELAWIQMFDACKREQAERLGKPMDSEEVLQAAGERFTEVVRRTQVYDSTLTRSEYMRSKDTGMKMATAFMAEPTTVVSMMMDGLIRAQRGDKAFLGRTAGAVAAAVIFNALAASLVYAARDDDEEKTYTEKYLATAATEMAEAFNPLEYLPYTRDIMSLMKGYDIERTDMALFADLFQSFERITSSTRTPMEKTTEVAGAVASFFGVPIKNLVRDARIPVNLVQGSMSGERTTGKGISAAMADEFSAITDLFGADTTNAYQLYNAARKGDTAHYDRVASRYESPQAAEMALRTALRENDKRIAEAAEAKLEGDLEVYESIIEQIESEGHFDRSIVIRAINNELLAIKDTEDQVTAPKLETEDDEDTPEALYKSSDLNDALERGDRDDFEAIMAVLIESKVSAGKTEAQARASVKSSVTSYWKKRYVEAWSQGNEEERKRILFMLEETGLYGSYNDTANTVAKWVRES